MQVDDRSQRAIAQEGDHEFSFYKIWLQQKVVKPSKLFYFLFIDVMVEIPMTFFLRTY
jgi:hypothetical protein